MSLNSIRSRKVWLGFAIAFTSTVTGSAVYSDLMQEPEWVEHIVEGTDENGRLHLSGGGARIWGIVPRAEFADYVTQNLVGETVFCLKAGNSSGITTQGWNDVQIVTCFLVATGDWRFDLSKNLSHIFIEAGVADEFCSETAGLISQQCNVEKSGN